MYVICIYNYILHTGYLGIMNEFLNLTDTAVATYGKKATLLGTTLSHRDTLQRTTVIITCTRKVADVG